VAGLEIISGGGTRGFGGRKFPSGVQGQADDIFKITITNIALRDHCINIDCCVRIGCTDASNDE